MNCKLIGNVFQALEATLNQGECFYAERGALIYMDSGIDQEVLMTGNGLASVISSKLSRESFLLIKYQNITNVPNKIVVSGRTGSLKYINIIPNHSLIL